jgi:hypothetical protein
MDNRVMQQLYEILQIADSTQFCEDEDAIIWQFNSSGIYSIQSLYAIINNRGVKQVFNNIGVKQVFTPVMRKLLVPPRLHILLWLLANNKTLTEIIYLREGRCEHNSCLFCNEPESVHHMFFGCCIAKVL